MKEKRQNFFHGAAVLAFAGVMVKIIGACYKIPLGNLLGPVGMADFSIAYNIYTLLFVLSTAGIPSAVSKMVSEADVGGKDGEVLRIYKVSYFVFAAVGLAGFSVMFFGAEEIAEFMGSESSSLSIKAISPAVMFVCISAINRGYFQGKSNMYPTAISEILEAAGKPVAGIAAAVYLRHMGCADGIISAGAISGVSAGAFVSAVFFAFCKDGEKNRVSRTSFNDKKIIKKLLSLAIPITASSAVMSIGNVVDSALVMNLLCNSGFSEYRAKWLFGAYNYAITLFNLPSVITTTVAVSAIPAISSAIAGKDKARLNELINSALGIGMVFSFPAAAGLMALSDEVMQLLYGANTGVLCVEASALILRYLCFAIPLLAVATITNSIHQASGRVHIPIVSGVIGVTVKILSNFVLVSYVEINILGAAISTVLCYGTMAVFNMVALRKEKSLKMMITKVLVKPILLAVVTYVSAEGVSVITRSALGFCFSTVLSVFVGFFVCVLTAFGIGAMPAKCRCGGFSEESISKFLNND